VKRLMLPNCKRWWSNGSDNPVFRKAFSYVIFDKRTWFEDIRDAAAVAACWWWNEAKRLKDEWDALPSYVKKHYPRSIMFAAEMFDLWKSLTTAASLEGFEFEPWKEVA